ncbi:MAG: hypothetical protein RLZ10_1799, partial [Bacteroidota bacterium]
EKYFPENYSQDHLINEVMINTWIVKESTKLILSSNSVFKDLKYYYPEYKTKPFVLHFAVEHPDLSKLKLLDLKFKFGLPETYFFCPNQFWRHKNHMIVIKAVELLKSKGIELFVIFSGKEFDPRSPGYTEGLKDYVASKYLENNIRFLGFIDRDEQLKLMEMSCAVIQPSLFEGWSTVIEEAMALNKCVLASDLEVNKEQLGAKGYFFNRSDFIDLAYLMEKIVLNTPTVTYNYPERQRKFAINFMNIINE